MLANIIHVNQEEFLWYSIAFLEHRFLYGNIIGNMQVIKFRMFISLIGQDPCIQEIYFYSFTLELRLDIISFFIILIPSKSTCPNFLIVVLVFSLDAAVVHLMHVNLKYWFNVVHQPYQYL